MKVKFNHINMLNMLLIALLLLSACEERPVGPDTVPLKAEIKNVDVRNSIYGTENINEVDEDIDTVLITVPMGTDVTTLDLDILTSFYSTLQPQAGITDLTNPKIYTVTSNVETREVMLMVKEVAPYMERFMLTSPVEVIAKIEDTNIMLEVMDGTDLSEASFYAEFFGESIDPNANTTIDLTVDNPTIKVINKGVESIYTISVNYIKDIVFTGKILDGTVLPHVFDPMSLQSTQIDGWKVIDDETAYKGKALHFRSIETDYGQAKFDYVNLGFSENPDESTTVFRVQGIDNGPDVHFLEMQFSVNDLRVKLYLYNDGIRLQGNDGKLDVDYATAGVPKPLDWNTYRLTVNKITGEAKLYVNEETTPVLINTLMGSGGIGAVYVGDGGGKTYECLVDYIAFETEGAYSPEELPIAEIIK